MRPARVGVARLAAAALVLGGCAVFASKAELRLVEQMRRERDPIARAEALGEYDQRFATQGRLGDRVLTLRQEIDEGYWQYATSLGLEQQHAEDYLARFPQGAHGPDATRRLDQLRYFAEREAARAEAQRQAEEEERRRVEEENERQRARVRGGLERWLRTALSLPRWGTTLEALASLDEGFREQWSGDPQPVCVQGTCRRTIQAFYFFAQTGGTRIDRSLSLVLQVETREGRVFRLTGYYTGRGFVDWLEMGSQTPIAEATEEERDLARDAMTAMVQGAISTLLPTAVEDEGATDELGLLLRFETPELQVSLREFPPDFAAGRVDGFQVTYRGDLAAEPPPPPAE